MSLREFLGLGMGEPVPDHSSMTVIRRRLPGAVYDEAGLTVAEIPGETSRLKLPLENFQTFRQEGLLYERAVALGPGRYLVKLVVRDAGSGLLGNAAEWVDVLDRNVANWQKIEIAKHVPLPPRH